MVLGWIALVIGVIIVIYLIASYNRFVTLANGIQSTFSQIDVTLKKRFDLIGALVDAVKGYMKFEKNTLLEVTRLRTQAAGALNPAVAGQLAADSSKLYGALAIQVEAYPKLRASENVSQLMKALADVEDEISRMRMTYNNTVQEFNTRCERFPSNLVASAFSFRKGTYLEMGARETLDTRPDAKLS